MPPEEVGQCFYAFAHALLRTFQQQFAQLEGEEDLEDPLNRMAAEALSATCRLLGGVEFLRILQHLSGGGGTEAVPLWLEVPPHAPLSGLAC